MQVVVLAAGQGTRLRPLTHDRPKNMIGVGGQPLLDHLLRDLNGLGIQEILLVVGHGHARVRAFVGDGLRYGLRFQYVLQERQLGSGHALLQARPHLQDAEFLLLPADAWYDRSLVERLAAAEGPALLQVEGARSRRHGIPVLEQGRAVDLQEATGAEAAPPSGGAYRLPRRLLERLERGAFRLRDAIRADLRAHGPWSVLATQGEEYVDVVELEDLLRLNRILLERLQPKVQGKVEPGAHLLGPVQVGEGSLIRSGAVLTGPVAVGRHCDIGPGAVLNPGTALRNHVRIGALAFLHDCCIGSNVTIDPQARVTRAVLDTGVKVGPGARVDGGLGAAIGADAVLEADSAVRGEGRIGRRARVAAGRAVRDVPDDGVAV